MAMNPEVKAKWVAALRSGEYKQAKGALRKGDGFCCLGLLCELHHAETGEGKWRDEVEYASYDGIEGVLPSSVMDWAGLRFSNPNVDIDGKLAAIAVFNDGREAHYSATEWEVRPRTFSEIADAIEAQL